jgi:hypothetical protein
MVDMVLPVKSCDVGSTESAVTFVAYQVQPPEVISLAQRVLASALLVINWEELRGYYFTTVLELKCQLR